MLKERKDMRSYIGESVYAVVGTGYSYRVERDVVQEMRYFYYTEGDVPCYTIDAVHLERIGYVDQEKLFNTKKAAVHYATLRAFNSYKIARREMVEAWLEFQKCLRTNRKKERPDRKKTLLAICEAENKRLERDIKRFNKEVQNRSTKW